MPIDWYGQKYHLSRVPRTRMRGCHRIVSIPALPLGSGSFWRVMRHELRAWAFCGISGVKQTTNTYRYMKQTLTTSQAAHLLMQDEHANWSYKGAHALIEHLEQLEEDCGMDIEFDQVALRCEWHEYRSAIEAAEDIYSEEFGEEDAAIEWLRERTQVIEFDGGVIAQLC